MVRKERLELSRLATLEPKSSASTNSATFAICVGEDVRYHTDSFVIFAPLFRLIYKKRSIPMKAFIFFICYFLIASALAALISYPLFYIFGNDAFRFESWVTRLALIFLILGLIPSFKYLDLSCQLIGHNNLAQSRLKQISIGFISGLLILSVVIFLLLFLQIRTLEPDASLSLSIILKALLAGVTVALIEETLFRGLFFKLSLRWHNAISAILISSFFYAILHFIKPDIHIDQTHLSMISGFEVIMNAFKGLSSLQADDFLALFSVGILLATVRYKTQSLNHCIGLHASWVFLIKICKDLTDGNPSSDWAFLSGNYDGIIGWFSFAWLIVCTIAYVVFVIKPSKQHLFNSQ